MNDFTDLTLLSEENILGDVFEPVKIERFCHGCLEQYDEDYKDLVENYPLCCHCQCKKCAYLFTEYHQSICLVCMQPFAIFHSEFTDLVKVDEESDVVEGLGMIEGLDVVESEVVTESDLYLPSTGEIFIGIVCIGCAVIVKSLITLFIKVYEFSAMVGFIFAINVASLIHDLFDIVAVTVLGVIGLVLFSFILLIAFWVAMLLLCFGLCGGLCKDFINYLFTFIRKK